jgi:hypothetical protein
MVQPGKVAPLLKPSDNKVMSACAEAARANAVAANTAFEIDVRIIWFSLS